MNKTHSFLEFAYYRSHDDCGYGAHAFNDKQDNHIDHTMKRTYLETFHWGKLKTFSKTGPVSVIDLKRKI